MIMTNSKKVLLDINCLNVGSKVEFKYKGEEYVLNCYDKSEFRTLRKYYYSVYVKNTLKGMNVDKISNKYLSLYTFDMMGTKTKYKMALEEMEMGKIICAE